MAKLTPEQREDIGRMRGLVMAFWVAVFTLLVIIGAVIDCRGQDGMSSQYVVPVVARVGGEAGSVWRTQLCVTNPHWYPLTVNVEVWQEGSMFGSAIVVPNNGSVCSEDFLQEWFSQSRFHGGLIIRALESENPNLDYVVFTADVRVYNLLDEGRLGVTVDPFPVFPGEDPRGFVHPWGQVAGVLHHGTPGEDGSRVSVGAFNVDPDPRAIEMWLRERNGNVAWRETLELPGRSQRQWPVPEGVEMSTRGSVTMQDPLWRDADRPPLYGYVTETDNVTGDGAYMPMVSPYEWQIEED
jgi:hypothetical protein